MASNKAVEYLDTVIPAINAELFKVFPENREPFEVYGIIKEFLERGGKRVRPALCMLSCEAVGGKAEQALPAGAAIELFHSFCLSGDTRIATNPGEIKPISEIQEGETVYALNTETGEMSRNKVIKRFENGVRKTYVLKTRNREIIATGNHPLLVARKKHPLRAFLTSAGAVVVRDALKRNKTSWLRLSKKLGLKSTARNWLTPGKLMPLDAFDAIRQYLSLELSEREVKFRKSNVGVRLELEWTPLEKLRKGNLLVVATSLPDDGREYPLPEAPQGNFKKSVSLPKTTTVDFCQIAGMFLGDGCLLDTPKRKCIVLCLPEKDEARDAYAKLIEKVFGIKPRFELNSITIYSAQVTFVFESLGLKGKALEKRIPGWVFRLPRKHKLSLLRGLLDSDGTVNKRGEAIFSSASRGLIEDVKLLLDSLGFTAGHLKSKVVQNMFSRGTKKSSTIYEVEVSNPEKVGLEIGSECPTKFARLKAKSRSYQLKHPRIAPNGGIDFRFFGLNPVTSIQESDERPVYDIMVEDSHNFIANGIVVHNSLIHDDVEDDGEMRRGKPCIHRLYGIPLAINAGDGLFVLVWKAVHNLQISPEKKEKICFTLANAFTRVLEGQAIELNWRRGNSWNIREQDYTHMASGKTGALIAASCEVGAFVRGGTRKQLSVLKTYGEAIGLAFQIQDDVLNLVGEEEKYKKEIGGDITEGKRSLITVRALEKLGEKDKAKLIQSLSSGTREQNKIAEAIELMRGCGAINYAGDKATELIKKAKKALHQLPESNARQTLESFADFFVEREH